MNGKIGLSQAALRLAPKDRGPALRSRSGRSFAGEIGFHPAVHGNASHDSALLPGARPRRMKHHGRTLVLAGFQFEEK